MEAERDVVAMLKLRFMEDKLGESFDGIITGVAQFGFFVQLKSSSSKAWSTSPCSPTTITITLKSSTASGASGGNGYTASATVFACVDRVDRERKRIDFSLSNE